MNPYDPYAPYAPQPAYPPSPPAYGPGGAPGAWTASGTLSAGWRAFVSAWVPLVLAPVLLGSVFVLPMLATVAVFVGTDFASPRELALAIQDPWLNASILGWSCVQMVMGAFFGVGLARMRLAAVRGQPVRFGELFSGASRFLPMLGLHALVGGPTLLIGGVSVAARLANANLVVVLSNLLGNLWAVALMVLQALGLAMADYFVADRNLGPIGAIKSALTAPGPERGRVFGTLVLVGLIAVAGAFCCALPALVTVPYASVCVALLYTEVAPSEPAWAQGAPAQAAPIWTAPR